MSFYMWLIQKINVAYCQLQIEGGFIILITCTHVEQVFGIPHSGKKLVLDTYRHRDGRVPSIQKIERLMVETECQRILYFFIIFACATDNSSLMNLCTGQQEIEATQLCINSLISLYLEDIKSLSRFQASPSIANHDLPNPNNALKATNGVDATFSSKPYIPKAPISYLTPK
ncbi:hypothetical protein PVL29_022999 [Vitis rotundifolia]|uniref:Uncharacterized protein n=1 Tax=Vitis rotundifolia TaxID=103349 RepID=A0AA39DC22_VITRO|nr:hypothetical protein PVL29_022999 [Vitis rotundifolia]